MHTTNAQNKPCIIQCFKGLINFLYNGYNSTKTPINIQTLALLLMSSIHFALWLNANILRTTNKASSKLLALKNTQATSTPMKTIKGYFLNVKAGILEAKYRLYKFSIDKKNACKAPQIIKVKFAPCHKPESSMVIHRFHSERHFPLRLPPKEM